MSHNSKWPDAMLKAFSIHATNITGLGATQLVASLLPALEESAKDADITIFLPESGKLSHYIPLNSNTQLHFYRRILPRTISRGVECLFMRKRFNKKTPLLTLGDIPIRGCYGQTLFMQQSHLIAPVIDPFSSRKLTYRISRLLFAANLSYIRNLIVQTEWTKESMEKSYPSLKGRISVIPQPPPAWLRQYPYAAAKESVEKGLRLFYPAAAYPHKNHSIFAALNALNPRKGLISELALTINGQARPYSNISWIKSLGLLPPEKCLEQYSRCHALIFTSLNESYGLPLIEAMSLGLPVVAADLPYARVLCKDQAIYFNPENVQSLLQALEELHRRLKSGWQPDWSASMSNIPSSWAEVASRMLKVLEK